MALPVALGEAFPCQHHGCGCSSAEACRTECCCFTPAERVEWARDHGDAVLLAAAQGELRGEVARQLSENSASDFACHDGGACCSRQTLGESGDCNEASQQRSTVRIDLNLVRRCRGVQEMWLVCFIALPPLPGGQFEMPSVAEFLLAGTVSIDSRTIPPPDPPPERKAAVC
jgi:hypothetical protein